MNVRIFIFVLAVLLHSSSAFTQRISQPMGRGVVAVAKGSNVLVSWRKLAQDAESAQYNVYARNGSAGEFKKLNAQPLSVSNYKTTTSQITDGTEICVTLVVDGKELNKSGIFKYRKQPFDNVYFSLNFKNAGSPLDGRENQCKFIWPVDLDGDGEMDYVVDRRRMNDDDVEPTDKVEAYLRDGTFLWTIDLGPNSQICNGHNDKVTVGDFDCDGKGEVVVVVSDGARFWNQTANDWGKYIVYGKCDGTDADSDKDGIIDYRYDDTHTPPYYIAVVDGMTGAQKDIVAMTLPKDHDSEYRRDNKKNFQSYTLSGHMGTAYMDGIHPCVYYQYCYRDVGSLGGKHHYYGTKYSYDFTSGNAGKWQEDWTVAYCDQTPEVGVFHQIRFSDVDGDGRDEMLNGIVAINGDGKVVWNSGIVHGDRFRLGDLNPEIPEQEVFAIQQGADDLLGQIVYSARNGEAQKRWYLSEVGDVGRCEAMDIMPEHKGYELWSTMPNTYTIDGKVVLSSRAAWPAESIWWDGQLDREVLGNSGSANNRATISKWNGTKMSTLVDLTSASGGVNTTWSSRLDCCTDIIGDWREENILRTWEFGTDTTCLGIMAYATDYETEVNNIYCLQQDPAYRAQSTCRGYIQTPMTSFYLGYDMPTPPLPPFMTAQTVYKSGELPSDSLSSILFGIEGNPDVQVAHELKADTVLMITPFSLNYSFAGSNIISCAELWKSGEGTAVLNVDAKVSKKTYISQGILEINKNLTGDVSLRALGTLKGCGTINGSISLEGALNYEGGRIKPDGMLTIGKDLNIDNRLFLELSKMSTEPAETDMLHVNGDVNITGDLVVNFLNSENLLGDYVIIEASGEMQCDDMSMISTMGISGKAFTFEIKNSRLVIHVTNQRVPSPDVIWTGQENANWDYQSKNFKIGKAGSATTFATGDIITFDDNQKNTTITVASNVEQGGMVFSNTISPYKLQGSGSIGGNGGLQKTSAGRLELYAANSTFTGPVILEAGTTYISDWNLAGRPSSIGAASRDATNLQLGKCVVISQSSSAMTDRGVWLSDTARINIPKDSYLTLSGAISGPGTLKKEGYGQLTIGGSDSLNWTGGIILRRGTLALGGITSSFGPSGSLITVQEGTLKQFYTHAMSEAVKFDNHVNMLGASTLTFVLAGRTTIAGKFTGKGTVNFQQTYVRGDIESDFSDFEGVITTSGKEEMRLSKGLTMKRGELNIPSGMKVVCYKANGGTKATYNNYVAKISGAGSVENGNWYVGCNNTDFTYSTPVSTSAILTKVGTGKMTLKGSIGGPVYVDEGQTQVVGDVTTSNLQLAAGTMLLLGDTLSTTVSTNTLSAALTINGGKVFMVRKDAGYDQLSPSVLTLNNATFRIVNKSGTEWKAGDKVSCLMPKKSLSLQGTLTIESDLPSGLKWDTSSFKTKAVLTVVEDPTGVETITNANANAKANAKAIYDLNGRMIHTCRPGQVYIIDSRKVIK